jgi:hypothetical protein
VVRLDVIDTVNKEVMKDVIDTGKKVVIGHSHIIFN